MTRSSTKLVFNNCLFATLYLYFRGLIKRVYYVRSASIWGWHYIVETKSGHFINFKHVKDLSTSYVPFWFLGTFRKTVRQNFHYNSNPHWFAIKSLTICVLLSLPYLLYFGLKMIPFWTYWIWDAIRRNKCLNYY